MKKDIFKNILIFLLIIILIDIWYSFFIRKDNPIKLFGKSFLIVTTDSMKPTINAGELVVISEKSKYELGDIVTYKDIDNFYITHRIIEIKDNQITTKGDGNNINDDIINQKMIKGKVIFHSKILGFFVLYLLKPFVIVYIIIFIIISLIDFYIKKERREIKVEEIKENINN